MAQDLREKLETDEHSNDSVNMEKCLLELKTDLLINKVQLNIKKLIIYV